MKIFRNALYRRHDARLRCTVAARALSRDARAAGPCRLSRRTGRSARCTIRAG